jgi:GxxExxY protein
VLYHEDTNATKSSSLLMSHKVIGAAIEVHRFLGPGLLESVYEAALCRELRLRGITTERQVRIPINYKGEELDCHMKLDLLVEKNVIVEVKSVDKVLPVHRAQLLTYLKLQRLWLGLIINFNVVMLRDGVRRVLNG